MKHCRLTALVSAIVLILLVLPAPAILAAGTAGSTVTLSARPQVTVAQSGDLISYDLTFDTAGINTYRFHLNYDNMVLKFESCTFAFQSDTARSFFTEEESSLILNYAGISAIDTAGTIATVTFTVVTPGVDATVTPVLIQPEDCVSFYGVDSDGVLRDIDYPVVSVPGTVTIEADYSQTAYYEATSVTGYDLITTEIRLNNLTQNICGTQAQLLYDPDKLEFVSAELNTAALPYGYTVLREPGVFEFALCGAASDVISGNNLILKVTLKMTDSERASGDRYDLRFRFHIPNEPAYGFDENMNYYALKDIVFKNGTVTVEDEDPYDLNGDRQRNIEDVSCLLNYLADSSSTVFAPWATGDCNGNGTVNIEDVTALLNILAGVKK